MWNQWNARISKWVKGEKGLFAMESLKWLQRKNRKVPALFAELEIGKSLKYL